jgi:predicted TIM-barrel fold metal-dependent hydrolase
MSQERLRERAARGETLRDVLIIDNHAHLGRVATECFTYPDAEGILWSMDRIGIRLTCVSASQSLASDYRMGNDQVAAAVRGYPDRFAGYVVINPNYQSDIEAEIHRGLDTLGLWAVKLHPAWHEYPPDGPAYQRVYAIMQERKGVVLSHTYGDVRIMDRLCASYPDVTFIHAHVGGGYDGRLPAPWTSLLRERGNLYLDTVSTVVPYGGIEKLVAQIGADRLVFGTDVPGQNPAHQLGRITHAEIAEEDKLKILGLNMQRIMSRR